MTPAERMAEIEAKLVIDYSSADDVDWLLSRLRRAEALLREAYYGPLQVGGTMRNSLTRDIRAYLAGEE